MWPAVVFISFALLAALWILDHRRARRERIQLSQTISRLSEQSRELNDGEKSRQQTLFDGMAEGVLAQYLITTLMTPLFPDLWAIRSHL